MVPYLKLDHIDKTFRRGSAETEVLKDITLGIETGEFVSMIGHSGCGKTTLLNIVAGLVPATTGCVLLEDREVNEPGPDRAVVFQHHSLLPWLTVYDNVRLAVDKVFGGRKSRADGGGFSGNPPVSLIDLAFKRKPAMAKVAFSVAGSTRVVPVTLKYLQGGSFRPVSS